MGQHPQVVILASSLFSTLLQVVFFLKIIIFEKCGTNYKILLERIDKRKMKQEHVGLYVDSKGE